MKRPSFSPPELLRAAVLLVAAVCLLFLLFPRAGEGEPWAVITVDGQTVREIPLNQTPDGEFSLLADSSLPITFRVENHRIRFLDSDCPDRICVNTGYLHEQNEIACCLPNKTILTIEYR